MFTQLMLKGRANDVLGLVYLAKSNKNQIVYLQFRYYGFEESDKYARLWGADYSNLVQKLKIAIGVV